MRLSHDVFSLSPTPPVFATLRRYIGTIAAAFVSCTVDDHESMGRLYALHVCLSLLLTVVKKAVTASLSPASSGFHAGEDVTGNGLVSASFMAQ